MSVAAFAAAAAFAAPAISPMPPGATAEVARTAVVVALVTEDGLC
jgi:hypothetical protein